MNQINKINKIDLSFYRFGPILAKYKLNNEFISTLLAKGTKSNIDISNCIFYLLKYIHFNLKLLL